MMGDMTISEFDKMLAQFGTSFDEVKRRQALDKWEIKAIEQGRYGRLRLSSSEKIARTICQSKDVPDKTLNELVSRLAELAAIE